MWPNPEETVDLVTLAEEILNGKLDFLYSVCLWEFIVKNLFKFNTARVKQGSFIHLIIALMYFFWSLFKEKGFLWTHVLVIKKPVRIIEET